MSLDRRDTKDLLWCVEGLGRLEYDETETDPAKRQRYVRGIDCIVCVQDLQRYLRRDDEKRLIVAHLGKWNVLKHHLLPLLTFHRDDSDLAFEIVKLMVMMTLPPTVKVGNIEEQLRTLQSFKESFIQPNPYVHVILSLLVEPLGTPESMRSRRDIELIELSLALFKNLLHIPDPPVTTNAANSNRFTLQDDFIETLKKESVLKLVLVLAQNVEAEANRSLNLLLLEIIYLLFRREDPKELVDTFYEVQKKNHGEKSAVLGAKLQQLRDQAALNKALNPARSSVRHSRFGGAFVTQTTSGPALPPGFMSAISGPQIVSKKVHLTSVEKLVTKNVEINPAPPVLRGRRPPVEKKPVSGLTCKLTLKELADSVLQHCYNELMGSIRDDMIKGVDYLVDADYENFYWVMGFFTAYHAHVFRAELLEWENNQKMMKKSNLTPQLGPKPVFDMSYLKSTLDDNVFLFLAEKISDYRQEKSYTRMATATKALKELLGCLAAMHASSESSENQRNAEIILLKLVYEPEAFLDRLVALVKVFTPAKMPLSALSNTLECVHFLLKLLESNSQQLVQKKKRVGRATGDGALEGDDEDDGAHLDHYEEDGLAPEPGAESANQGQATGGDGATANPASANENGEGNPNPIDEGPLKKKKLSEIQEDQRREADQAAASREKYFDFQGYLAHFAKYSVLKNYAILLRNYRRNSTRLNHVLVKYFYRVIHQLKLEALLFQVSVLRIFDAILHDTTVALNPDFTELRLLAEDVSARVVSMFKKNPSALAVQMLFPKTRYEAELHMRAKMAMEEDEELHPRAEAVETGDLTFAGAASASLSNPFESLDVYTDTINPKKQISKKRASQIEQEAQEEDQEEEVADWDLGGMIANEKEAALARLVKEREKIEEKRRLEQEKISSKVSRAAALEAREDHDDEGAGEEDEFEEVEQEIEEEIEEEIEAEEEQLGTWTDEQDQELKDAFDLYKEMIGDPDLSLWEAISVSVERNAWACYRRLQMLGVELPFEVAPPEVERASSKQTRKKKVTKKVMVKRKKASLSSSSNAKATTTTATEGSAEQSPAKTKSKQAKEQQQQQQVRKKPQKKRAFAKELEDFIVDDDDPDGSKAAAEKEKQKKERQKQRKKNSKKRARDSDEEEDVVSHMSDDDDEEVDKEDKQSKKKKKTKKNGAKRQKLSEDGGEPSSITEQLRLKAFEKDNEDAEDEDLNIRFVPRRGRLMQQSQQQTQEMELNLELDDDEDEPTNPNTTTSVAAAAASSSRRRGAILDDDDEDEGEEREVAAAATKPAPAPAASGSGSSADKKKRFELRYEMDSMDVDIPDEEASPSLPSASAPTPVANNNKKAAGARRIIDEEDDE